MTWEMIGHDWAVRLLCQHLAADQVRHAYLITGPDGIGKRTLALRFIQALNCETAPEPGGICGECRACRLILSETYPDLHVVQAESIDGVLKVDQIRQLQRQLSLSPYEGKWRVALLLRFHEANDSAANALLKTLEEPAPKVVLVLTARSAESLLPTIVSRCEVVPLRAIARNELEKALLDKGETQETAVLLTGLSAGRPGWALSMAENPKQLERRSDLLDDLMSLIRMNRSERFAYIDRLTKDKDLNKRREVAIEALTTWLSLWRDVMITNYGAQASRRNTDRFDEVDQLATSIGPGQIFDAIGATESTLDAIHRYVDVRLALEAMVLDLPKLNR